MEVAGVSLEAAKAATPRTGGMTTRSSGAAFAEILRRASTAPSAEEPSTASYTVQRGDNLTRICRDYLLESGSDVSSRNIWEAVREVSEANGLSNPNLILPGQQLDLSVLRSGGTDTPAAAPPEPEEAVAQSVEMTDLTPLAGAAKAESEFLPLDQTVYANIPVGFESLMAQPEFVPLIATTALTEEAAVEPLEGIGPLPEMGDPVEFTSAEVELERALNLMEGLVAGEKSRMAALEVESPWSQVISEPAHLTSEFGVRRDPLTRRWEHHEGIDLAAPKGSEIRAYQPGEVVFSGWQAGYGQTVIVRHDDGLETVYGHNSKNLVSVGQRVDENTTVAEVGSTGRSTGPHLHFEVRRNGVAIDPIPFLAPAAQPGLLAAST